MTKNGFKVIEDCIIEEGSVIRDFVHLIQCVIGRNTKIATFVEIQKGVVIGEDCKIQSFVFIPQGVSIGDRVFIGPNVTFTNDKYPKALGEWKLEETIVMDDASIGAGATILPGVKIGKSAVVAAGAVVTKDVPEECFVFGVPAKVVE